VLGPLRYAAPPRWPRFAIDALHRDVSLLVVLFLVIHIITSVLDTFAPIKLADAVLPVGSSYRPLWMGLGALSFDLIVALVVTSLLRRRVGYRHWLAYASWPVALLHGLGSGTDTKTWWMLAATVACTVAVLAAVWIRIGKATVLRDGLRPAAIAATIATPLGIALFALLGPLQAGWARRAGTPTRLLGKPAAAAVATPATRAPVATRTTLHAPFSAGLTGTINQSSAPGGSIIDIALSHSGGARGRLRVRIAGTPLGGGGLSMTGSQVVLAAGGLPAVLQGRILSLQGTQFLARVAGPSGSALNLHANLNIDGQSGTVTGSLSAAAAGGGR
jgi:sulfoxide reductase heme-binding subunit YedZ